MDNRETKYVLSLDGGGIKGAFIARILDNLSKELGVPVQAKFDLIFGTSIGGLLGLKLAQTPNDKNFHCQSLFTRKNTDKIFDKSFLDNTLGVFQWKPVYNGKGKSEVIREVLTTGTIDQVVTPVAVTAYKLGNFRPQFFKSWEGKDCICTAADITSAAPIYFPPIRYDDHWYIDGGIGINNPSLMAIAHAMKMFPNCRIKVLSIGTGSWFPKFTDENITEWGLVEWVKHGILDMFMTSASQANDIASEIILGDDYLRYNHKDLIDIATDDTSDETLERLAHYGDEATAGKKEKLTAWLSS